MRVRHVLSWAVVLVPVIAAWSAHADVASDLAAVEALGDLTNAPTVYTTNGVVTNVNCVGTIQAIMYDGQDYTGSPTRVFAYIGMPAGASSNSPVPAAVCVHGGGGTAISAWVEKWNERGYAAIAMDTEGRSPIGGKHVHEWAGPQRTGIYDDMAKPIGDHYMYHATADTILANSLLRSLPEIDADKVGVVGVSWGGVITSTTIGIDDRFAFAVPTYGCGHMHDALNNWGAALGNNETYKTVWDPVLRMTNTTLPVLWFSWPEDYHFPMDCQAYTYHPAPGEHMVSLVPGMGHGHGAMYLRPESYDFADNVLSNGTGWCVQQSISLTGSTVEVVFAATRTLKTASLIYTTGTGKTGDLTWPETNVTSMVESPAGTWTITAQLPEDATGWFVNTTADANVSGYRGDGDVIASSDYQEVIALDASASALAIVHPVADDQSTGTASVVFSMPTNVEVTDIQVGSQSHAGAFTNVTTAPLVVTSSPRSIDIAFDNTVAGLSQGETATGIVAVTWENLDGSTEQGEFPVNATVTVAAPPSGIETVTIGDSGLYRSQDKNADELGDSGGAISAHPLVGFFDSASVGNMHLAWAFEMTGVSNTLQLTDADFSVTQVGRTGSAFTYDIQAHIIRTSNTADLVHSDYEDSAVLLMTNFNGGVESALKSLDATGESALLSYLQENWVDGEYIVIGLKTTPRTVATYTDGSLPHDYYRYAAAAQLTLTVNHDITEVEVTPTDANRIDDNNADAAGNTLRTLTGGNNLVGYYDSDSTENMHLAWSFQMTGFSDPSRLLSADFEVNQTGRSGAGNFAYDVEAHAIRTSAGGNVAVSDYQDSAALLMTNFAGSGSVQRSLDAAGRSALTSYLQSNWSQGDYVFIGLKTDPITVATYTDGSLPNDYYKFAGAAGVGAVLNLTVLPSLGTIVCIR